MTQGQAVEHKIDDAISNQAAFYLELTDEELSALLLFRAGSVSAIRDISVSINPGVLEIDGSLGNTPSVGFSGSIDVVFENGLIDLNLNDVSLSFLPVPDGVKEELRPLINQGLDINQVLGGSGAPLIQRFAMQPGRVIIVGVQTGGQTYLPRPRKHSNELSNHPVLALPRFHQAQPESANQEMTCTWRWETLWQLTLV